MPSPKPEDTERQATFSSGAWPEAAYQEAENVPCGGTPGSPAPAWQRLGPKERYRSNAPLWLCFGFTWAWFKSQIQHRLSG